MSGEKSENNLISLSQASEITGYNQDYLGFLARTGKLEAQKIGRNWVTSISAVNALLGNNPETGGGLQNSSAETRIQNLKNVSPAEEPAAQPVQTIPAAPRTGETVFIVPPVLPVDAEPVTLAAPSVAPAPVFAPVQVPGSAPAPAGFAESDLLGVKQAAQKISEEQRDAAMRANIAAGVAGKLEKFQEDFKAELGTIVGTVVAEKTAEKIAADAARAAALEQAAQEEAAQAAKEKSNVAFKNASSAVEVLPIAAAAALSSIAARGAVTFITPRSLDTAKIYSSFQKNLSAAQVRYAVAGAAASVALVALAVFFGYGMLNSGIQKQLASLPVSTQKLATGSGSSAAGTVPLAQPQKIVYIQGSQTVKYVQGPAGAAGAPGPQGPQGSQGSVGAQGAPGAPGTSGQLASNGSTQVGVYNPSNGLISSPYVPTGSAANVPVSSNSGPQTIFSSGQGSFNSVTTNDLTASTASLQSANIPSLSAGTISATGINAGTENVSGAATFSGPVVFTGSVTGLPGGGGSSSLISTTTPQLTAGYDTSHEWSASTNSAGATTFSPSVDGTAAFTFASSNGTPIINVDTTGNALTSGAGTTIGLAAQPFTNGYFGNVTVGSTLAPDANAAIIFQRNAGNQNAQIQWNAGSGDLRYFTVNYPVNATYTIDNSSISTTANLYSGMLTNNTTSGTQNLLSLTNAGTGTTANGIYLNNMGTGTTALDIAGTWANGIVTNNSSINAGTGTITGGSANLAGITASGNVTLSSATPIIDSPNGTLDINTATNQPVTFGTGAVTFNGAVAVTGNVTGGTYNTATISGGTLSGGSLTATSVNGITTANILTGISVASANGFTGSSSGGATPSLTIGTSVSGILQGNGTSVSAAPTTGSGSIALANSPVFTTPNIGSATGSISGNAATVTTDANLTGVVTSTGNATSIAAGALANSLLANSSISVNGTNVNVSGSPVSLGGTLTLSLPQSVAATSTPTFASGTLTATTSQLTLGTANTTTISATAPAASRTYTIPDDSAAGVNFVLAPTSSTATQALFASATPGSPAYRAIATTDLPSSVVTSTTNGTNVTGSISGQDLTLGFTGQLGVASGGTGAATITGLVKGNGTSPFTAAVPGTDYQVPLTFTSGLTNTSNTVTNNLTTGIAGNQTVIGSTSANGTLTLQGNSASSGNTGTSVNTQFNVGNSGATNAMTILNSGNVGIGTTTPTQALTVAGSAVVTGQQAFGNVAGINGGQLADWPSPVLDTEETSTGDFNQSSTIQTGSESILNAEPTTDGGTIVGADNEAEITDTSNSHNFNSIIGDYVGGWYTGTGEVGLVEGVRSAVGSWDGSGTIDSAVAGEFGLDNANSGNTIENNMGLLVDSPTDAGTLVNNYGLYIKDQSGSGATGDNFNVYSAGSAPNYFAGNVGIGTASPSSLLSVGSSSQFQVDSSGDVAAGTWQGSLLSPTYGGTGLASATPYAILAGGTTSTAALQQVSGVGTTGQVLTSNGASALPTWQAASGGTVTAVSIASANGFSGSSSGGATPALTIATSVTGLLEGNGTAVSAATAGTDYSAGTSGLATGILKSTTGTGALTVAVASDFPTLNQNTTGNAANVTGVVALANGGTNANLTASSGGIFYSTGSAGAILAGTSTANQVLLSGSSAAPAWSSETLPASTTVNQLLYSSSANTVAGLATAGSGVLVTSSGGVPSISGTLPSAVQGNITSVGTVASGTWQGSLISPTYGGTGVNNGSSTLTLGGNLATSGAFATTLTATAATTLTLPTSGTLLTTAGSGAGLSDVVNSITGTANQVIASAATGAVTLSLPQSIATTSTPTFASGTLTATTSQLTLGTANTTTISAAAPASSRTYTIPDDSATGVNFVLAPTSSTATQALFASATPGSPAYRAIATADLPSSVVTSTTNGTNVTGSISGQDLTLGFTGQLGVASGGTGAATITGLVKGNGTSSFTAAVPGTDYQVPLTFGTGLTNSSNTVTNNLTTGIAGNQTVIGSTSANGTLTLQGNSASSGNTSTNADLQFNVGNSGATTAMTILNSGNVGIGTPSPSSLLSVGSSSQFQVDSSGNVAAGTWQGSAVAVQYGGTGLATATPYAILAGGTTSTGNLQQVSGVGTTGQVLTSNGASALPTWQAAGGSSMVYPGAGIPNSTGSAWGTSYTTTGSGTVVALQTSPTFVTQVTAPLVIGSTSANGTLALQGNSASSGNTGANSAISLNVGNSGATNAMTILNSGNVGIGTVSPGSLLTVSGTAGTSGVTGTAATQVIAVTGGAGGNSSGATTAGAAGAAVNLTAGAGGNSTGVAGTNGANITLQGGAGGTGSTTGSYGNLVLQASGGDVGIGTSAPTVGGLVVATAGAASFSGEVLTGSWFTSGGTGSTTKPQLLVEPAGTTSTGWNTAGTGLGVNAASGFTGNLIDVQLAGTSEFKVNSAGVLSTTGTASFNGLSVGANTITGGSSTIGLRGNEAAGSAGYAINLENNFTFTYTAGTGGGVNIGNSSGGASQSFTYSPTSGSGVFNASIVDPVINQTSTASGITRGLLFNPVLTSVADYRNFETQSGLSETIAPGSSMTTAYNVLFNPITYTTASTYALTSASTLNVAGAPTGTTSTASIATSAGITVQSSALANVTNGYGLYVSAPTGASTGNYAATFATGSVGIDTTAPAAALDVKGSIVQTSTVFATEVLAVSNNTGACAGVGQTINSTTAVFLDNAKVPLTSQIFYNTTSGKLLHATISGVTSCTNGGNTWYVLALNNTVATQASGDTITLYTPAGDIGNNTSGFTNNLYAINGHFVTSTASGGFDVAEQYQTTDATMGAGDVVSIDPANADGIVKSWSGYDSGVVGVVSTTPGLTLGANIGATWQKVALTGRVPVLVSDENGVPEPGDFLTASAMLPGYAMKATHSGKVIGEVLDSWSMGSQQTQVVNGLTIHTEELDVDLHVGWENVDNTFVVGVADPVAALASTQQADAPTGSLAASPNSDTFIIRQNIPSSGTTLADILQLQSGSVTRLMVASSGATTINASVGDASANVFAISNNGTSNFTISASGNVVVGGTLVVKQDLAALGEVLGSTAILAQNADTSALHQGEVVMLDGATTTPVVGSNPVITVMPAVAPASSSTFTPVAEPVIVGIVDRNLADFSIPGAPAASGSDITVVAPGEYADVVTAGTYAVLDVDASFGAISVGDRLTISLNAGYARKVVLPTDAGMPVVGVALDALAGGTGHVRVLLTLGGDSASGVSGSSTSGSSGAQGVDPATYGQGFDWTPGQVSSTTPTPTPVSTPTPVTTPVAVTPTPDAQPSPSVPTPTPTVAPPTPISTSDQADGSGDTTPTAVTPP